MRRVWLASLVFGLGAFVVLSAADDVVPLDSTLLGGFKWRGIGPASTGGRVSDFAVARVPGSPDAIYVGTASGGVFKSTNQGTSWMPVFDRVEAMMSVGDVAVARSNPNIVWVATGEANNRQSSSWGDGVYKSTDAGRTWKAAGLKDTRHIGRIVVHPTVPDTVYVAAVGHLWGSNVERGVFKTTDGGATWKKVLFVDEHTGATDLVMSPDDPNTLFAAMYQRQRKAWGFNGGGPGSGIYRTSDGGATWKKLTNGLPSGDKGRIGLDIFAGNGRLVLAIVEAAPAASGLYRTRDGGDTWEQLGTLNPRPMYYSQIRIDPRDERRVYMLGSNRGFYVSDDGGRSFRDVFSQVHSEDHALWIDPDDTNRLIVGGDGGVSISWDRGATWLFRDNLPIGQFYEIGADMRDPYTVCGGLQDNGVWCVPSATRNRQGISNRDAFNIGGGDGFHARIDPTDSSTVVIESQEGRASRVDLATLERQPITPLPAERLKRGEREKWNWNTPIVMSVFDPKVLYIGSNVVFRSTDRGATWKAISPDLTANIDRESLRIMGAPVEPSALSRHDGQSSYSTLTTIGESPLDPKLLYTGSDDGQLHATRDGGETWSNVTAKVRGIPPNTYVSSVVPSRHVASRVYATFDGHYNDDYRPYVYASEDYGQTWRSLVTGLASDAPVRRLREHPGNSSLLVIAHERGLHVSIDRGASWASLASNMPPVPVADIMFHPRENDLIAGTHGRGIWILDNAASLEKLTSEVLASDGALLPGARGLLLSIYNPQAWYGAGEFFGPNPEFGAAITYYLRSDSPATVRLQITDSEGRLIRTLRGPARRGLNHVSWDLRMEPPVTEGQAGGQGNVAVSGSLAGPFVLPGIYAATLELPRSGRTVTGRITVDADPRARFSDADRQRRQSVLLELYDLERTLVAARRTIRSLNEQTAASSRARTVGGPAAEKIEERAPRLSRDVEQVLNAAAALSRAIEGYSGLPTADQRRQIDWAFDDAAKVIGELNTLVHDGVPFRSNDLSIAVPKRNP